MTRGSMHFKRYIGGEMIKDMESRTKTVYFKSIQFYIYFLVLFDKLF